MLLAVWLPGWFTTASWLAELSFSDFYAMALADLSYAFPALSAFLLTAAFLPPSCPLPLVIRQLLRVYEQIYQHKEQTVSGREPGGGEASIHHHRKHASVEINTSDLPDRIPGRAVAAGAARIFPCPDMPAHAGGGSPDECPGP